MAVILAHLSIIASGVVFCAFWIAVAVGAAMLVHRVVPRSFFEDHYEQAGFIFAVIGVVYAVVLAFVAIGVWERFDAAESKTYDESMALVDVYRDSGVFPNGASVRADLRQYTELVVRDEWPKMIRLEPSEAATLSIEHAAWQVDRLAPKTLAQEDVHASMLDSMDRALGLRAARVSLGATGLNPIVWVVIIGGAVVTIGFSFLFPFKRRAMQAVMVGALTFSIVSVLYLASSIDYPFRGDITVQPHAFEHALTVYDEIDHIERQSSLEAKAARG